MTIQRKAHESSLLENIIIFSRRCLVYIYNNLLQLSSSKIFKGIVGLRFMELKYIVRRQEELRQRISPYERISGTYPGI